MEETTYSKENPFQIFQISPIRLSFVDKLRVLFGKKITVHGEICVDREVEIVSGKSCTIVEPIFNFRKRSGMEITDHILQCPEEAKEEQPSQ